MCLFSSPGLEPSHSVVYESTFIHEPFIGVNSLKARTVPPFLVEKSPISLIAQYLILHGVSYPLI